MSLIMDRLYVGSKQDAHNRALLVSYKVDVVINCSKDIQNYFYPDLTYYRLPVNDDRDPTEFLQFEYYAKELLPIMYEAYMEGKCIFIHCFAGMQRSAALALLFVIYYQKHAKKITMSVEDAQFLIISKRPFVFNYGMCMNFETPVRNISLLIYNS